MTEKEINALIGEITTMNIKPPRAAEIALMLARELKSLMKKYEDLYRRMNTTP